MLLLYIIEVIDVAMKDLEDFVESAEAEIEALLKDVSPEDAEEAMNKAGITEEDLDEAENEVEESLEEVEDEVEKGDVSEGDVEEVYTAVGDDADA